jgi:hypothetical protein
MRIYVIISVSDNFCWGFESGNVSIGYGYFSVGVVFGGDNYVLRGIQIFNLAFRGFKNVGSVLNVIVYFVIFTVGGKMCVNKPILGVY